MRRDPRPLVPLRGRPSICLDFRWLTFERCESLQTDEKKSTSLLRVSHQCRWKDTQVEGDLKLSQPLISSKESAFISTTVRSYVEDTEICHEKCSTKERSVEEDAKLCGVLRLFHCSPPLDYFTLLERSDRFFVLFPRRSPL